MNLTENAKYLMIRRNDFYGHAHPCHTAQKSKFSVIWNLVTFTEEMLNGKLQFLCSVNQRTETCKFWFFDFKNVIVHKKKRRKSEKQKS